jgi:hypothetical protein
MAKAKANEVSTALVKATDVQDNLTLENASAEAAVYLGAFSEVEEKDLITLTEDYLKLDPDETYNLIFTGMTKFTGERGGEVDAVQLIDEENKKWINGNTVLVNSLKKVTSLPCMVRVVTKKMIKTKNGTYQDLDVFVLSNAVQK